MSRIQGKDFTESTTAYAGIDVCKAWLDVHILGEPGGWRRYGAITAGFLGVLVIARPGAEGINAYAFWAVAVVFFMGIRDLTRAMPSSLRSARIRAKNSA